MHTCVDPTTRRSSNHQSSFGLARLTVPGTRGQFVMRKESKAREVKPLRTTPIAGNHRTIGTLVGTLTNTIFDRFSRSFFSVFQFHSLPFSSHFVYNVCFAFASLQR